MIWRDPARLQLDEQQALDTLAQRLPWVTEVGLLVQAFRSLLWSKQPDQVEGWLRTALHSDLPDLRLFAESLQREQAALEAAVALPWSQGPVEGIVNKIKLIRRQMYGRASFPTLCSQVLSAFQHQG